MNHLRARLLRRLTISPFINSRTLRSNNTTTTIIRSRRNASSSTTTTTRLSRLESRLPPFLRRYLTPLRNAPLSHISAFLVLHELTAVLPLFGLAALFHYSNWLPSQLSEGVWVQQGVQRFGRYARKKGWVTDSEEVVAEEQALRLEEGRPVETGLGEDGKEILGTREGGGKGVRIVLELGTAWAITKALLPLRLGLSVWATPWFARVVCLPVWGVMRFVAGRGAAGSAAAVTTRSGPVRGTGVPLPKSLGGE